MRLSSSRDRSSPSTKRVSAATWSGLGLGLGLGRVGRHLVRARVRGRVSACRPPPGQGQG
eukprot:scaffold100359_cov36-Phaeocystis_antarctica.AAC.1